jgi:hypothetical protein
MKKHLPIFSVRIILVLSKRFTSIESNQNNSELNIICEAAGCYAKATDKIKVRAGPLGVISLLVCSDCVTKFQESE